SQADARGGFGPAGAAGSLDAATATNGAVASATTGRAQQAATEYLNSNGQGSVAGRYGLGRSAASVTALASARQAASHGRGLNNRGETVAATYSRLGRQNAVGGNAAAIYGTGSEAAAVASTAANEATATSAGAVAMQNAQVPASAGAALNTADNTAGAVALGGTATAAGAGTTLATGGAGTGAAA
ncbi:hypothetical protein, partial [Hymenobacter agri]